MSSARSRDWRVLLLAVGGGTGGLLCLGSAAVLSAYSLLEPWLPPAAESAFEAKSVTGIFVLTGGMVLVAAVLIATFLAALRALRAAPTRELKNRSMPWWSVLLGIAIWLGSSALVQVLHDRDAATWAIPVLHLLAIAVPIYVLTRLAIAGIRGGSWLRLWGSISTGMLLGTGLAALVEILLLLAAVAAGGVYLLGNPQKVIALQHLAAQLERVANPEEAIRVLGPMLTSPLAMLIALGAVAVATPLIEELAKSIPVWILHDRLARGSHGFWAGALSGAGFALFEGIMVSSDQGEGLAFILVLRAGSSLMHILTSGLAGWGIGEFRASGKGMRMVAGYAGAMALHSLWNAVVVAIGYGGIRSAYGPLQQDPIGLTLSVGGGVMLLALIGLLPIALVGLNLKLRDKSTTGSAAAFARTDAQPKSTAEKASEDL